jgi:guanylate kinase
LSKSKLAPTLIVVSAPSGTGKSTILECVLEGLENIRLAVSHTTRQPRPGEVDGGDYYFVTRDQFQKLIDEDRFLEWAEVYPGRFYGTSRDEYERAVRDGFDLITDLDVQGAAQVRLKIRDAVTVFILPPSYKVLASRLRGRAKDKEVDIKERLAMAISELRHYREYDYVLVNDRLEECVKELRGVIRATRARIDRADAVAQSILKTFEREQEIELKED